MPASLECACLCRSCFWMPSDVGMMVMRPGSLPKSPESIGLNNSTDTTNFSSRKSRSRGSSPAEKGYRKTSLVRNGAGPRRTRGSSPGEKVTGSSTLPQSRDSEWVSPSLKILPLSQIFAGSCSCAPVCVGTFQWHCREFLLLKLQVVTFKWSPQWIKLAHNIDCQLTWGR